jgi:preprotein translocase subunit YajC
MVEYIPFVAFVVFILFLARPGRKDKVYHSEEEVREEVRRNKEINKNEEQKS